jgi:hypothetical protein
MSPRPHDGPAEEGLSSSFLGIVQDPAQVEGLRTLLSGFCHRCRNSLNGIKMSLYLFRRESRGALPDCWGEVETIYHDVEHLFDHLQTIYRPLSIAMVRSALDDLIDQHAPKWRSWFESRGRSIQLDRPEGEVRANFDPAQLGAGLDALAEWRAVAGDRASRARIAWRARDGAIEVFWDEIPGQDARSTVEAADGAAWGRDASSSRRVDALALPVLARIVAAHGGCVERVHEPGFHVHLRWPQFERGGGADDA